MPNVEEEITENNNNENERNGLRRNSENSNEITRSGGSRSLIGRFRRGAYVFCLLFFNKFKNLGTLIIIK